VSTADLGKLFETFRLSAFRLEMLPSYDVTEDAEREAFRLWSAGDDVPAQDREWPRLVASAVAAGKTMQRVRLVQRPLSDYIRFEMEWGYPANVAAGEDIRILELAPGEGFPYVADDFWLFDNETAVWLDYDEAGRFIGPVLADDVTGYRRMRDYALAHAMPFSEYRASLPT
jgi:hypothetical protein